MHRRIGLVGLAALLLAGCAEEAQSVAVPAVPPARVEPVAASSGGACRLLDFAVIAEETGTRFSVAAASARGDTHTCVVRGDRSLPELTLTVSDTSIDVPTFTADILPDGAKKVAKLGQVAYKRSVAAKSPKQGPAAEVGWLAGEGRLATLRWTFAPGTPKSAADELTGRLVALAKGIKTRSL